MFWVRPVARLTALVDDDLVAVLPAAAPVPELPVAAGIGPAGPLAALPRSFRDAGRALETAVAFGLVGGRRLDELVLPAVVLAEESLGDVLVDRYITPVRALGPFKLAQKFAATGLRGAALNAAISDHMSRELAIGPSVEVLPDPDNRVTLARDQLDPLGLPRPRIQFKWSRYEQDGAKVAMDYVRGLMNALGATDVQRLGPSTDSAVMGGTCRMGNDARTSVVDRNLRTHDHPNLYLVGSATFPTITASPPTLTIAAFAMRAGLQIRSDLQSS